MTELSDKANDFRQVLQIVNQSGSGKSRESRKRQKRLANQEGAKVQHFAFFMV